MYILRYPVVYMHAFGVENSFLFKAKDHYASEGIFLKTDKIKSVKITPGNRFSFRRTVYRYRDHISEKISSVLPGEYGALITAMLMGEKSGQIGRAHV